MKKAVVFLFVLTFVLFGGCNLISNTDTYVQENIDMTPRLISLSTEMNTVSVVKEVKSAVVGIKANINGGYSIGSGVAIAEDGYILTNQHVVDGAKSLVVYFANQTQSPATVIWQDSSLDIAVIKSNISLPYLVCSEETLEVGEDVIAIGTPLTLDFKHTVTKGIISALNRTLQFENANGTISYMQNLIQHDASINPGNSGGPIINLKGEVVGINTLKASEAEGIGFAIPISIGKTAIQKLSTNNSWTPSYMGVFVLDNDVAKFQGEKITSLQGVFVSSVDENSICKDCFIKGDIILELNNKKINSVLDLRLALFGYKSGDSVIVKVLRNDEIIEMRCNISQR